MELWSKRLLIEKPLKVMNYTLPQMTSYSSEAGTVASSVGNQKWSTPPYNFFFGGHWQFEASREGGQKYNQFTFPHPLKPDTYTISFAGNLQAADRNSGFLSVYYTDGTQEKLLDYTLSSASKTFSRTLKTKKLISIIRIDMTVSTTSSKNDVTHFYSLNITNAKGQLQVVVE